MKRVLHGWIAALSVLTIFGSMANGQEVPAGTVKVFILAGQSNMQGKGSVKQFEEVAKAKPDRYGQWWKNGEWAQRDDVWCAFNEKMGKLTPGYGWKLVERMGPELAFGEVVGNAFSEPVVLLKTCWGGQSLAVDFRPPSSGGSDRLPLNLEDGVSFKPGSVNWAYKEIFTLIHKRLDNIGTTFPELKDRKWEIVGLVWFQGWNDLIDANRRAEYKTNMVNFIRDIRKDLKIPNLPIVIGESGQGGDKMDANVRAIAEAQRAAAEEFKGTVISVPTAPYWRDTEPKYDGGYHYNGNAETYYDIGEAFGNAMLGLMKVPPSKAAK